MSILNDSGFNMFEDLTPYLVGFGAWLMNLNWVALVMLLIAAARLWVAYQELKLKKESKKNASNSDQS